MSKTTVLEFLKNNYPNFYTVREIGKAINVAHSVASTTMKKLREEYDSDVISKIIETNVGNHRITIYRWRKRK